MGVPATLAANGNAAFGLSHRLRTRPPPSGHAWLGADVSVRGTAKLATGVWTHLAVTYNGTILRYYVNGVQVSTLSRTGAITTSTGPLRIGGNGSWATEFLTGRIDEVRVYNRALTAAEITSDMTTPITP